MTGLLSNARLLAVLGRRQYLPPVLSKIHESTATPVVATVLTGTVAGVLAFCVDISVLTELVSAATLAIFSVVNCAALVCVVKDHGLPDREDRVGEVATWSDLGLSRRTAVSVAAICAAPVVASALSRLTGSAATSMALIAVFVWLPACLRISRGANAAVTLEYGPGVWAPACGVLSTGFLFCSLHAGSLMQYAAVLAVGYGIYAGSASRRREERAMLEYVAGLE